MFKSYIYYLGFKLHDIFFRKNTHKKEKSVRKPNKKRYLFQKCIIGIVAVLWLITAGNMLWGISGYGFMNYISTNASNVNYGDKKIVSAFEGTFDDMSFKRVQGSVSVYGRYCDVALTDMAKRIILEQIAEKIGINKYSIADTNEDENSVKTLSQTSKNGDVICKLVTVNGKDVSQYIYIGITLNDTIESIFTYENIVNEILNDLNIEAQVTVNLKGVMEGELSMEQRDIITNTLMEKTGAYVVAEKKSEDMYTVYGYDSSIKKYILSVKDKINVNISMNYNEKTNETNVYYSTPINSEDY